MSPKLPPDQAHWAPVPLQYWQRHYGTEDPARILLLLQRDYPDGSYRLEHGRLECLVDEYDAEEDPPIA